MTGIDLNAHRDGVRRWLLDRAGELAAFHGVSHASTEGALEGGARFIRVLYEIEADVLPQLEPLGISLDL